MEAVETHPTPRERSADERTTWMNGERKLAMFMDFENIARGVKEAQYKQFELKLVLERLLEKGKIIVRRAYADWNRFTEYKRPFHEWAIELIDVPQSRYSGKNSADIRMLVAGPAWPLGRPPITPLRRCPAARNSPPPASSPAETTPT